LRATDGTFEFQGEGTLEVSEAPSPVVAAQPAAANISPVETPAGPADTLHVLAALNEIGADVGEPIDLSEDAGHLRVVVHVNGLSAQRQRQVAEVLKPLPRVVLDVHAGTTAQPAARAAEAKERYAPSMPAALRQQLEDRLGGAAALQEVTDQVLEGSASTLAQAHALQVLSEKFPPAAVAQLSSADRELLGKLRQSHLSEIDRQVAQIRTLLKPLLTVGNASPPWRGTPASAAQEMDALLNRLLAGSYSQVSGEEMLRNLTPSIERLEQTIRSWRQ
jgi:hypothetical protein